MTTTGPAAIPPQAITDATERVVIEMRKHPVFELSLAGERLRQIAFELAAEAAQAAAPHLEAAERERCAQLAEQMGAFYSKPCETRGHQHSSPAPFASLLREQP